MKLVLLLTAAVLSLGCEGAARLKDIATLQGVRKNQLTGYGVVVGLSGTGDKSFDLTNKSLAQTIKTLGVDRKEGEGSGIDSKNAASVFISATLPPFAKAGTALDITVSSIGSASSLENGVLVLTPLRGPDGQVYALAQGKVTLDKKESGGAGAKKTSSSLVTASILSGAVLEKDLKVDWNSLRDLKYFLHNPDFTTASRAAKKINEELAGQYANAVDAGTLDVLIPYGYEGTPVELVARLENVEIESDLKAKVIVNSRNGTVVLGGDVQVLPVAVAHQNIKVEVKDTGGDATKKKEGAAPDPGAEKETRQIAALPASTKISDLVNSLNTIGAGPDEVVALLQAMKSAGALLAELEIQ